MNLATAECIPLFLLCFGFGVNCFSFVRVWHSMCKNDHVRAQDKAFGYKRIQMRIQFFSCKGCLCTEQQLPAWGVLIRRLNRAGAFELHFAVLHRCPWIAHCSWLEWKCHILPGGLLSPVQGVLSGEALGHLKTEGCVSLCELWRPRSRVCKTRGHSKPRESPESIFIKAVLAETSV